MLKFGTEAIFDEQSKSLVPTKPSALKRPIYWYTYRGIRGAFFFARVCSELVRYDNSC